MGGRRRKDRAGKAVSERITTGITITIYISSCNAICFNQNISKSMNINSNIRTHISNNSEGGSRRASNLSAETPKANKVSSPYFMERTKSFLSTLSLFTKPLCQRNTFSSLHPSKQLVYWVCDHVEKNCMQNAKLRLSLLVTSEKMIL